MAAAPHLNENDLPTLHSSDSMYLCTHHRAEPPETLRLDIGIMPVFVSWPPRLKDCVVCSSAGEPRCGMMPPGLSSATIV